MSTFKSYREESRANWGRNVEAGAQISNEDVRSGCLLRIADATEAMAKNHLQLINSLDYYKRVYSERGIELQHAKNQLRAARGQLTRLKNKLKNAPLT